MPRHLVEFPDNVGGFDQYFVMDRPEMVGHLPGKSTFREQFPKTGAECMKIIVHVPGGNGSNCTRVHPAGQKRSDRHIGNQPKPGRFFEERLQPACKIRFVAVFNPFPDNPIRDVLYFSGAEIIRQGRSRPKTENSVNEGFLACDILVLQITAEGMAIDFPGDSECREYLQKCFYF